MLKIKNALRFVERELKKHDTGKRS